MSTPILNLEKAREIARQKEAYQNRSKIKKFVIENFQTIQTLKEIDNHSWRVIAEIVMEETGEDYFKEKPIQRAYDNLTKAIKEGTLSDLQLRKLGLEPSINEVGVQKPVSEHVEAAPAPKSVKAKPTPERKPVVADKASSKKSKATPPASKKSLTSKSELALEAQRNAARVKAERKAKAEAEKSKPNALPEQSVDEVKASSPKAVEKASKTSVAKEAKPVEQKAPEAAATSPAKPAPEPKAEPTPPQSPPSKKFADIENYDLEGEDKKLRPSEEDVDVSTSDSDPEFEESMRGMGTLLGFS